MILDTNQELFIRISVFAGLFLIMMVWEWLSPGRQAGNNLWPRRGNNLLLVILNNLMLRFVLPMTAVGMAIRAVYEGWGILTVYSISLPASIVISLIVFDLAMYLQHVMFHKIPVLWHLHRVHHIDEDLDTSTGLRFHPLEIAISMLIRIMIVVVLGAPALAVMLFELILNACALFNHGNVYIAPGIDKWLRWLIVTPDMHRVHHSSYRDEIDSNYGFNLSCWDRIFGTYREKPRDGHLKMRIGMTEFSGKITVNTLWLLLNPFMSPTENNKD